MNFKETFFPDYLSQIDRKKVFGALLFTIVAFGIFLLAKPPSREKGEKIIANLESYSNNVRYKESGSVTFYDAVQNEKLQNGDEVFTGKNSVASVKFINSQTILKIPSSSLVRIENGDSGDTVEIKDGLVDIFLKKDHEINVKANGVDHQIKSDQESVVKAYYSEGELHFFTKDKGVKINKVNDLSPNLDSVLIGNKLKNDFGFVVLSPTPGERLESSEGVKISINQKSNYSVTLSKNADFSQVLLKASFNGANLDWDAKLDEGDYFLKVEDQKHRKIIPITFTNKFTIDGFSPADGETLKIIPGETVTFRWNSAPVNSYRLSFRDIYGKEKIYVTDKNEIQISDLKGAWLEWSVFPEVASGKYLNFSKTNKIGLSFKGKIEFVDQTIKNRYKVSDEKKSIAWKAQKDDLFSVKVFEVNKKQEILTKQLPATSIDLPLKENGSFEVVVTSIIYPGMENAKFKYEVEAPFLVWDSALKKEVKSIESNEEIVLKYKTSIDVGNNGTIQMSFKSPNGSLTKKMLGLSSGEKIKLKDFGEYCFKGKLKLPIEHFGDSEDYCLKYIQLPAFTTIPKARDSILEYQKHNGVSAYKVSVPTVQRAVKYQIEIFRDNLGKKVVYTENSQVPYILWKTNRAGIYYLRYKVYDYKNRESGFSPFSKLIFPISPLSNW